MLWYQSGLLLHISCSGYDWCHKVSSSSLHLRRSLTSLSPRSQSLINGGMTIWSWLVALVFAFTVNRVGRRVLFLTSATGMLIFFTCWTVCSAVYTKTGNSNAGTAVLVFIFLFYGSSGIAWPGLALAYTVEICPYRVRAKALTFGFFIIGLSAIFNQYVNPIGIKSLGWKFYIVYIVVLVLEVGIIYFFFIETKGPSLEEIAELFDGANDSRITIRHNDSSELEVT
jgi:MFS family permease